MRVAEIRFGKKRSISNPAASPDFPGHSKIDEPGGRRRAEEGDLEG
jgi:hypothetical protein